MPRKPYSIFQREVGGHTYYSFYVEVFDEEGNKSRQLMNAKTKEEAGGRLKTITEIQETHGKKTRLLSQNEYQLCSEAIAMLDKAEIEEKGTIVDAVTCYLLEKEAESQSMLLSEYTEKVTNYLKNDKGRSDGYIARLRNEGKNLQNHFGNVYINKIKGSSCDEYLAEKDILPVSANSYKNDISAFFRLAKKWELIKTNPAENMDAGEEGDIDIVPADPEYLIKYLREANEEWIDFYIIEWFAGLRTSEARALKYEDCYRPRNPDSLWTVDLASDVATKTDYSPREIEVHSALKEFMEYRDFENKSGFICPYHSEEYSSDIFNKKWKAEREQKGMFKGYRHNVHRKTFATYLYALKKGEKSETWVKEQLGHEPNSKVTRKNYVAFRDILKKNSEIPAKALEYFNLSPQMVFGEGYKKGHKKLKVESL